MVLFLRANRPLANNAFMTSASKCGGRRGSPIRIWGVGCAGFFAAAEFERVEAFADYISYGTPEQARAFAHDRAAECRDQDLQDTVARHRIASADELLRLAVAWEEWGEDPGTFFAFVWCRALAWP